MEGVGFEPTDPLGPPAFEAGAIVHSATLPMNWRRTGDSNPGALSDHSLSRGAPSTARPVLRKWLPGQGSNLRWRSQSPLSYQLDDRVVAPAWRGMENGCPTRVRTSIHGVRVRCPAS